MRTRYTVREPDSPHFITCTVVKWIPLFTRKPYFDILLDTLQFCRQHKGLKLYAYVILDNHLHLVVSGPKLADIIRDFKSYTAKRHIAQFNQMEGGSGNSGKPPPFEGRGFGGGWQNFNPPE